MALMADEECTCGFDDDWKACVDGVVYGPCEAENCYGACQDLRDCECKCHEEE